MQFGEYANYVGSHFWNFQDELAGPAYQDASGQLESRPSALYRATERSAAPNLLLFDASGSDGLYRATRGAVGLAAVHEALRSAGVSQGEEALASSLLLSPHPCHRRLDACEEGWEEEEEEGGGGSAGSSEEDAPDPSELPSWREWESAGSGSGTAASAAAAAAAAAAPGTMNLDSVVQTWGDFCKASLNPRGLVGVGGRSSSGDAVCSAAGAGLRSGLAAFDAFSDGSGLVDEACRDRLSWALEACDSLQGIQAVVDIDSGWGGFGVDTLRALRDECPKAAMLVMGVSPPRPRYAPPPTTTPSTAGTHRGVLGSQPGAEAEAGEEGASLYTARNRSQLRAINLALAYAAFGAGDLDSTLVPLSLQSAMEAGASSFPGLIKPSLQRPYQTSALLACAWDSITLPFRRSMLEGGGDFLCPAMGWRRGSSSSGGSSSSAAPVDGRMTSSWGSGAGSQSSSTSSSSSSASPLVALPPSLHMQEYLTMLRAGRGHTLRISSASLALPFPHPSITPSALSTLLGCMPPPSHCSPALLTPLSHGYQRAAAAPAAAPAPFAHALVSRGVGSALGAAHTPAAYGCALDEWMARDACREAGHAVLRTPMAVPITLPRLFPRGRYSSTGGMGAGALGRLGCTRDASASARTAQHTPHAAALAHLSQQRLFPPPRGWASLPPSVQAALGAPGGSLLEVGGAGAGVGVPFSVPVLAHLATHPGLGRALGGMLADMQGRDSGIGARYGAEASGAGGGAHTGSGEGGMTFSEAEDALGGLVDEYSASERL